MNPATVAGGIRLRAVHAGSVHGAPGRLLIALAVIRLAAAAALVAGPWTDEATELAGWDVERFQAIADDEARHWVDVAVEYPPGSVVLIEAVAGDDVVATHRTVVIGSLLADLAVAGLVGWAAAGVGTGRRGDSARRSAMIGASVYLALGLPLVPMGLLRFDLWAALPAVAAIAIVARHRPPGRRAAAAFGVLVTAGALIKVWPGLLVAGAVALRRWSWVGATILAGLLAGVAWLAYGRWDLGVVEQVVSLRGATGWHVEGARGRRRGRDVEGQRPRRSHVQAAVPVLRGPRERLPHPRRGLRRHRGGHRHRPHGAGLRRGRPEGLRGERHRPRLPGDEKGRFTSEVSDWQGINVLEANPAIIAHLKERGVLVKHVTYDHNYPHCWRTDEPLIYKAVSSWYVKVTEFKTGWSS